METKQFNLTQEQIDQIYFALDSKREAVQKKIQELTDKGAHSNANKEYDRLLVLNELCWMFA